MNLNQIAAEYLKGVKLTNEARELTHEKLAARFKRSLPTIGKINKGLPVNIPEREQQLIRDCLNRRTRCQWEASPLSMPKLCAQYRLCHSALENELVLMGEREVAA